MKQTKQSLLVMMMFISSGVGAQTVKYSDWGKPVSITYNDGVEYKLYYDKDYTNRSAGGILDNAFGDIMIRKSVSVDGLSYPVQYYGVDDGSIFYTLFDDNTGAYYNTTVTSFTVEDGFTEISGLEYCRNLTSVIIPNSVTTIGNKAFNGCFGLTSIKIPNSVTDINDHAFMESGLTSIIIPNSVTHIGTNAFAACANLKHVIFEENSQLTSLGAVFNISGIESLRLPSSVKNLYEWAFGWCDNLEEIIIPSDSEVNEDYYKDWVDPIFGCNNLKNVYAYSQKPIRISPKDFFRYEGDGYIKDYPFGPEEAILHVPEESIDLYRNADGWSRFKYIVADIFEENGLEFQSLESNNVCLLGNENATEEYAVPNTITHNNKTYDVTAIAARAFMGKGFTSLTIPSSIKKIGENAFTECSKLKTIESYSREPIVLGAAQTRGAASSSVFEGVDKENCVLYVPEGCVEAYRAAEGWGEFKNILEMGGTAITGTIMNDEPFDVYNIQGHKVLSGVTSFKSLPSGVYIICNEKVKKNKKILIK